MKNEYNTDVVMEPIGKKIARWVENEADIKDSMNSPRANLVYDRFDNQVFLLKMSLLCAGLEKNIQK